MVGVDRWAKITKVVRQGRHPNQHDRIAIGDALKADDTRATLADIEQVEPELLSRYTYYFRGIWQEVPTTGQAALVASAAVEG